MRWDTVIVGSGAAGSCLAARLSEDCGRSVLLVEAGRDYALAETPSEIASANPYRVLMPDEFQRTYLWYEQQARRTRAQKPKPYWIGKGVGGSSSINAQIAIRGVLEAFDRWSELGCDGWTGDSVLPYFKALENDLDFGDRPFHGNRGPIPIYRAPQSAWGPVDIALRDAGHALGHIWCDDLNAPDAVGITTYAMNSRQGRRVSVKEAYLEPSRGRQNLTVMSEVMVDRVLLSGRAATGIRVVTPSGPQDIEAGEVILSAGAVNSPAILMRSGLGARATLEPLGIPSIHELPGVGENMMEHPAVRIQLRLHDSRAGMDDDFRHTNCAIKLSSGLAGGSMSDLVMVAMNHGGFGGEADNQWASAAIHMLLYDAHSRGRLTITSADPGSVPDIDLNMLSDRSDLDRLRFGVRHLFEIGGTSAVQEACRSVGCGSASLPLPVLADASDEQIDAWLLSDAGEGLHPAGTCRMGALDDHYAVVDKSGRVRGIRALRVIDASIMPADCRANTHLTTIMIAEKIAAEMN